MFDNLLSDISAINQRYSLLYRKTAAYFNIFDILEISSDERAICKVLSDLLNPAGLHSQGDTFLRLFINDVLNLNFTDLDFDSVKIFREYYFNRRRIDIVIISANFMVPIEVKIYAADRDKQCFDYLGSASDSSLFYLTLDGHLPDENSVAGLSPILDNQEIIGYERIKLLSFKEHIIPWLHNCLTLPSIISIAPIREILLQFKESLRKLTGLSEDSANMDIVNTLLSSTDKLKQAIDIANALPDAKTSIMLNFFRELRRLFAADYQNIYDYDEDSINQYYFSRKRVYPCLSIQIAKLNSNLSAMLSIEVDWNLFFSVAIAEVDENYKISKFVDTVLLQTQFPELFSLFSNAVCQIMGNGESSHNTVYWDYIRDDNGELFNFKNFSPACINLAANYLLQAETIFIRLRDYISKISGLLENTH